MTTLQRLVHETRASLGVAEVEELLARTVEQRHEPTAWHLDLHATRHVQPLAGPRLAAVIRELSRYRLKVTLPARRERYRVLYRSGLIAALAAHAHEVVGEGDPTLDALRTDPFTEIQSPNLLLFNRVDEAALVPEKDRFAARLWAGLKKSLPEFETRLDSKTRAAVSEAGYEAVANIVDHGYTRPFEGSDARAAFVLVSWQEEITVKPDDPLGLAAYLEQARGRLRPDGLRWVMVTIVDDGNGIPARHSLDSGIYSAPLAEEEASVASALRPQESVKLRARDAQLRGDPGWGLPLLADALKDASAYGCLRTGRQLIEADPFAVADRWVFRPQVLAPMRGTALQLVIPAEHPQLELGQ
jgi:hypothetical protein